MASFKYINMILSILFTVLAAICSASMDVISFRWKRCVFNGKVNEQWANPAISWKNKWKDGIARRGEKFLGSSTIFVMLTDMWHFAKFAMIIFMAFAVISFKQTTYFSNFIETDVWVNIINALIDVTMLYLAFTLTFEYFFTKILIINK